MLHAQMRSTKTCNTSGQSLKGGDCRIRYAVRRGVDRWEGAEIAGKKGTESSLCLMPTSPFRGAKREKLPVVYSTISVRQANSHRTHNAPGCIADSSVHTRPSTAMNWHRAYGASSGSASLAYPSSPMHSVSRNAHGTHDSDRPLSLQARIGRRTQDQTRLQE